MRSPAPPSRAGELFLVPRTRVIRGGGVGGSNPANPWLLAPNLQLLCDVELGRTRAKIAG